MQAFLRPFLLTSLTAAALTASPLILTAQKLTTRCDPAPGSLSRLSRAQKKAFTESQDAFIAGHFAHALGELRNLLEQIPQNTPAQTAMAERTAEAAIEAGQQPYAISLLKPIEARDGSDCPARTLLARAYAETGQSAERDAEINALTALRKQAPTSPAGKLDLFLLEQHPLKPGATVQVWYALQPFPPFSTHLYAQVLSASGKPIISIELDSYDGDQVYFRQIHPEHAAKGERQYSLDAFKPDAFTPGHQHALIQFYDGAPGYDAVRQRILTIAERAAERAK
jgi:hypothetical protein